MGLNLGQDWEFQPDAPNNRLFAEYGPTGSSVSFGEDGDLTLDDGNLDLSGGSLTDSSQDYVDLSGGGSDLRLATGQAIEDGSGVDRLNIRDIDTQLRDESGKQALTSRDGSFTRLFAHESQPVDIYDQYGIFTAVEYTTSASAPGTLELTNANLDAGGNDITNVGSVNTDRSSVNRQSGKFGQTTANNTPEGSRIMLAGSLSAANTFEDWIYLGAEENTNIFAFGRIGRADLTQTRFVLKASNEVGTTTLDVISGDASFFQTSGDWVQFKTNDSIYGREVYLTVIVGSLVK